MQGRRLPDGRRAEKFEPGDYQLSETGNCLYVALPTGEFGALPWGTEKGWTWVEEDDGTLTVTPSIHDTSSGGYHGWLQRGVWT
jgi:hypothetical protein